MIKDRLKYFSERGKHFAFDTVTTACAEVDEIGLSLLPDIVAGQGDLEKKYRNAYPIQDIRSCIKQCNRLLAGGTFGTKTTPYRHVVQNDILALCLHASHRCNLNCEYCYADAGTFGDKNTLMSEDVMLRAIDFAFKHSGRMRVLDIGFFGGEPLLNFRFIKKGVAYAKKLGDQYSKKVMFSMTSNATLFTKEVMEFVSREGFSLILSCDGPAKTHDRMRKTGSGKGTHSTVLGNILTYMRKYSDAFTVRGTFTRATPNFTDQVLFLNEHGFRNISVEPAQMPDDHPYAISRECDILRVNAEYDKLADIYLDRLFANKPISFFHFDYGLRAILEPRPIHTQCGAGSGFISITPDGKIFPCFEAAVEKENCIGDIGKGFNTLKRKKYQRQHADIKKSCNQCWARYFCGGGCHALNYRFHGDITLPYIPNCEFTKKRYTLSAWILSKVVERGDRHIQRLRKHLGLAQPPGLR